MVSKEQTSKMIASKKEKGHKKEVKGKKQYKIIESSDDDDGVYTSGSESEVEELNEHEYHKLLGKLFPSKHMNKKIKAGEKLKKAISKNKNDNVIQQEENEEDEEELVDSENDIKEKKKIKSSSSKSKKKKSTKVIEESSDDDNDDEYAELVRSPKGKNFNIIFTVGGQNEDYSDDDDDDSDWTELDESEDEDESVSTDSSYTEDEYSDEEGEVEEDEEDGEYEDDEEEIKRPRTRSYTRRNKKVKDENENETEEIKNKLNTYKHDEETLANLKELYEKNPTSLLEKCIKDSEQQIKLNNEKREKKMKKQKEKNGRIFRKIIRDKNTMNDFKFFESLEKDDQIKIIKEVREVNKITRIEKPYRIALLESKIPAIFKATAMKKINSLRYMEPGSGEFYKIKNWVDTFMRIPFNKYEKLPINMTDGTDSCHEFMEKAKQTLDAAVYGLNDAKMQIMQMLGQLVTNPTALGTAIAIKGPMGTGKTTLVKEGISKILNRPFAFIALGGATDSSFLEGHSYTYEGSIWGKIVQIIIDSKCMNPVIYFDELDKVSDTPKGEEITGILTHLTDTSQNSQFHDKYFAEIDFDLSKCLFIFSYNDESKVNPILRDRMYRIQTKGYDKKQKSVISTNYLLPTIRDQICFKPEDIIIPEETIYYIIDTHCNKEDGVRNLKRCLEIIYTKLNLYRLMKPGTNLFEEDMSLEVTFPFEVTNEVVNKLIKRDEENQSYKAMYI